MLRICPNCKQRVVVDKYDVDVMHTCNSNNNTIDQEDHFNIESSWYAGIENKLQGTKANIEYNERLQPKTTRGNRKSTHTTRQKIVSINIKDNTWGENPIN